MVLPIIGADAGAEPSRWLEAPLTEAAWTTLARESLIRRDPWLEVLQDRVELPDGRVIEDFYTIRLPDFAVVTAFTEGGEVVAETHYRPGAGRTSLTLPAGFLEPAEEPLRAAQRELLEETGFAGGTWTALGSFIVDGNRGCGRGHFFLAEGVRRESEPSTLDLAPLRVHLISFARFLARVQAGDVCELATATGLGLVSIWLGTSDREGQSHLSR